MQEESGRRKSGRISRKPKRTVVEESASEPEEPGDFEEDDEDDYFSEEEPSPKKRKSGGPGRKPTKTAKPKKKIKVTNESELSNDTNSNLSQEDKKDGATDSDSSRTGKTVSRGVHRKFIPKTIFSDDYAVSSWLTGLEGDVQRGGLIADRVFCYTEKRCCW